MGGKTKQTQRTKNNAKPSSSFRSAELLGTAVPTFIGFSAHAELGMVPFAPGLATEQLSDTFDGKISPQYQLVLRKMSKKDPKTKKKALLEFIELVNESDMETIKIILPLWPKFYQNLANDPEHSVRELAQTVLQLLVTKCKRAVAPYLKQLVPVWLTSQFDSYAPAASIASNNFRETFSGGTNRAREVCLHCQAEVLEYIGRNLTFHTAATLSSSATLAPVEAEQKYQRILLGSLKALSFFVEKTAGAENRTQIETNLQNLLTQPKFWSISKHKLPVIKAAWFEVIFNILKSNDLVAVTDSFKSQLLAISFQNIDDSDPLVAPQVWGCVLLLQSNYKDWSSLINVKKSILPRLSSLLRNGFNRNAETIAPNMLPFFSMILQTEVQDVEKDELCKQLFDDMKSALFSNDKLTISKSDCGAITKAYHECLRYLLQKINNQDIPGGDWEKLEALAYRLVNENILEPIAWLMNNENMCIKYFFGHTSALVAFWSERHISAKNCLYTKLLNIFWHRIFALISEGIENRDAVDEQFLEHTFELLKNLHLANPNLDDQRVKFAEAADDAEGAAGALTKQPSSLSMKPDNAMSKTVINEQLKELVISLVRICFEKISTQKETKYIGHVHRLIAMFPERDVYVSLTADNDINSSLDMIVNLINALEENSKGAATLVNGRSFELLVEIVFDILQHLEKQDQLDYIRINLLKINVPQIQTIVLQRLLSYPLCIEPKVRTILAEPEATAIIIDVAREVISDYSKEKLNLLHKCFFQTDAGDILIGPATVDEIVTILSQPLANFEHPDLVEVCGSFIAQIMPVVCNSGNSSKKVQCDIFLKLFRFSVERKPDDYISEDTLWEITTCWQDALSSNDILVDDCMLRECAAILEACLNHDALTPAQIEPMAESMAKLITCSTENITEEEKRLRQIDDVMGLLFRSEATEQSAVRIVAEFCVFLEALKGEVTPSTPLADTSGQHSELKPLFARTFLNFSAIFKLLVCKVDATKTADARRDALNDDEITDDYCDASDQLLKHLSDQLIDEIIKCIYITSMGDVLVRLTSEMDPIVEMLILELSEKVKIFMLHGGEKIMTIKERLLSEASKETDVTACRALTYLVHYQHYAHFEENATILLAEDLSDYFVNESLYKAYVNSLQYLLPELKPNAVNLQCPIMRTEPNQLWVKAAVFRCLVRNNFNVDVNEISDKNIIASILNFITDMTEKQQNLKEFLLYDTEILNGNHENVINTVEYMNLLIEVIERFPSQLTIKNWDAIRIGLSSWAISVSKSISHYRDPKVALFIVTVCKLFTAFTNFIRMQEYKSSTELLSNVTEEWKSLFAREVNLVLFRSFYRLCKEQEKSIANTEYYIAVMEAIIPTIELLDYQFVYQYCKVSQQISFDDICTFLLKNLSNPIHSLRICCVGMLKSLTPFFVADDINNFEGKGETLESQGQLAPSHFLNRFEDYIYRYGRLIAKYLGEFSFKLIEIPNFQPIDRDEALSFLLLWDCMVYVCAHSPISVRSIYTHWLHEHKFEENLLHFLFRAMPAEILKNYDAKSMNVDIFKSLTSDQIKDPHLPLEKYACHLYSETLRRLPAVVRKWWNACPSRQKTYVDKLTTNYVSTHICNEELRSIGHMKEKHENMQVNVHTSTREVHAVYSIDEVRMELVITLANNYPLGTVKVECGKQIGGKLTSRNVGMQLTIFITHQNGTIFDGLTLWKNNLDKKFEGVEECYVCYTVIHQETCQLPKLTCKTCKKKFHGPCLYKWFTTSSKSTCPICRNVF